MTSLSDEQVRELEQRDRDKARTCERCAEAEIAKHRGVYYGDIGLCEDCIKETGAKVCAICHCLTSDDNECRCDTEARKIDEAYERYRDAGK